MRGFDSRLATCTNQLANPGRTRIISRSSSYADVALAYWAHGFQPIPVHEKRPVPAGTTGRSGSVTPEKIADWLARGFSWKDVESGEYRSISASEANTALRAGVLEARVDVDDYGQKQGAAQLAELEAKLGPLPATFSSTSRGADSESRQHFFQLKEPVELVGKAAPDIDIIQNHHRYSLVWPSVNPDADGAPYLWYDPEGNACEPPRTEDLEYLPEAWVEYLMVPDREFAHTGEQYDGDIPDTASKTEERKLRAIVSSLQELPAVWREGAGWHDTVYRAACWLARIARSNAYALANDTALQLLLDHAPTYGSAWPVERIIEQWESALSTTAGQFEEPPAPDAPPLLPWAGFPTHLPLPEVNGQSFYAAWSTRPEGGDGAAWGRRRQLFVALASIGVSAQEAATIVWHSAAAQGAPITFAGVQYPDPDSRCITEETLWRELEKAGTEADAATGATVEAAPVDERPSLERTRRQLSFLSDAERELVEGSEGDWWGRRFLEWARKTFGQVNEAYYRANRWAALSIIFASKAKLPKKGATDRPLNIYILVVGPTTSGKSEAFRALRNILKAYFLLADSPSIGGDHTPESLAETLINRDGLPSFFYLDEAHTVISSKWKKPVGPYTGLPGAITQLYDGEVEALYRATKKDISGKEATTFLTVHLMGTEEGMVDVIEPEDWASGLIPRFVWARGERLEVTKEMVTGGYVGESEMGKDVDAQIEISGRIFQQYAAEFSAAAQRVSRGDGKGPSLMTLPDAVLARFGEFAWELRSLARQNKRYADRLEPAFIRLTETVLRAAALVSLSRGRLRMEMSDLLIALEQAEEWAANAADMVEATDESVRTRRVNAIEQTVLEAGGAISLSALNRAYPNRRREVDDYIGELVAQGRVEKFVDTTTHAEMVRLKGITSTERSAA